jgi:hypothetical protein
MDAVMSRISSGQLIVAPLEYGLLHTCVLAVRTASVGLVAVEMQLDR